MRKRQVQIVLLCEDDEHESFVLGHLVNRGFLRGRIRVRPYPSTGLGSGKEFVRRGYVAEVRSLRKYCRMNQTDNCSLVVVIDQDSPNQPDPFVDLDTRLSNAGLARRARGERIAILAPRYSVETWVYHLLDTSRPVDEITNFSQGRYEITNKQCRRAGAEFTEYNPNNCPLPSLVIACEERERL